VRIGGKSRVILVQKARKVSGESGNRGYFAESRAHFRSFDLREVREDDGKRKVRGESNPGRLIPQGAKLRADYKGKLFRATARGDGTSRYQGATYESFSHAGKAVVKRAINGWWFWKIERSKGNWVQLTKVRRAGTPVYE
jgi:hypothetical protein